MGMGYAATGMIAVKPEEILKLDIESFNQIQSLVSSSRLTEFDLYNILNAYTLEEQMVEIDIEWTDEAKLKLSEEIKDLYETFISAFKLETGVDIYIQHHDQEDNGDSYDDIDGLFFELDFADMYEKTEAHKQLEKKMHFDWVNFVTYS